MCVVQGGKIVGLKIRELVDGGRVVQDGKIVGLNIQAILWMSSDARQIVALIDGAWMLHVMC